MLQKYLSGLYAVNVPVMLWSNPGTGKSSMIKQFAQRKGVELHCFYGRRCEPSDIGGIPFVSNGEVKVAEPSYIKKFQKPGNILFCDELSTCPPGIQAALLTVILDCNYGEFTIDQGTFRIGAGNYSNIVGTHKMSLALTNRFVHLFVEPDPEFFAEGLVTGFTNYEDAVINPDDDVISIKDDNDKVMKVNKDLYYRQLVGSFIKANPTYKEVMPEDMIDPKLVAWPSPRTWEYVCRIMAKLDNNPDAYLKRIINGTVGEAAGKSIWKYFKTSKFHGINIPDYVGRESDFKITDKFTFDEIEATFTSAMYYFTKEPEKYSKLMMTISNAMFDEGYHGMINKFLTEMSKTYVRKLNYDMDRLEEEAKWFDLIEYMK